MFMIPSVVGWVLCCVLTTIFILPCPAGQRQKEEGQIQESFNTETEGTKEQQEEPEQEKDQERRTQEGSCRFKRARCFGGLDAGPTLSPKQEEFICLIRVYSSSASHGSNLCALRAFDGRMLRRSMPMAPRLC